MDQYQREKLMVKYLSGEASISELKQLKALLKTDQSLRKQFVELQDIWNAAHPGEFDSQRAFLRFKQQISHQPKETKKFIIPIWFKYAAIAAVVLVSFLIGHVLVTSDQSEVKYFSYETAPGERKTVQLPDGTKVWLSGQTVLTYASNYNGINRCVKLNGEAFFDVMHNAHKPFEVYSGTHIVKVLGTRFKLEARSDESWVTTVLEEGKVEVTILEKQLKCILLPGQKSIYDKKLKELQKRVEPNIEQYTALTKGQLVFNDEPLHILAQRLEKWYGVSITVDAAVKDLRFTGTFEKESIDDVLNILSMSKDINYTRVDGTINITLN